MAHDFREVKAVVMDTVKDMDKKDPNWKWKAVVQKAQVKIFWSYLEYKGNTPPFIITDGTEQEGNTEDDFIVLRDERGYYMNGAILGEKSWQDGDLEKCVVALMRGLQSRANSTY
jgi:hypothetical protein